MRELRLSTWTNNMAANSHAICLRTNQTVDVIRHNWQHSKTNLPNIEKAHVFEHLWIERLSETPDSPAAQSIVSKELNRPTSEKQAGLRATLFLYDNKIAELVLVADKRSFSKTLLIEICRYLLKSEDCDDSNSLCHARPLSDSDFDFAVSLLQRQAESIELQSIELNEYYDIDLVLAVVGIVLTSYELYQGEPFAFMQLDCKSKEKNHSQRGFRSFNLPVKDYDSVNAFVEDIAKIRSDARSELEIDSVDSNVSFIWNDSEACYFSNVIEWRYLPCLGITNPLTFIVTQTAIQRLTIHIAFDNKKYSSNLITSLLGSLRKLLLDTSNDGDLLLKDVDLICEDDKRIVANLGSNELKVDGVFRIENKIAMLAKARPEKIAIQFENQEIDYRRLNDLANQIAHGLIARGSLKGDHIGVCMSRSIETVVAILGILKVGAVYVPIDPYYPAERISYTCLDGNLKFIISELKEISTIEAEKILPADRFFEQCRDLSKNEPDVSNLSVNDAAYIIYTSGSTGKPKGVVIPHRNVSHLINATEKDFELNSDDVWSLFHSTAFDFSVWEIWGCLLTGAKLVVVPYWTSRSVDEFVDLLRQNRVTVLSQTPSAFVSLIQEDEHNPIGDSLRLVIFGGEALDTPALLPWFDRYPESQCRLVNMYGITETTVHVTAQTITRHHALIGSRSVGRVLPGWYLYVLDENRKLLPPGVTGEIYVGGAGVALHYHGKPELTKERFVEDPFNEGLMYKSGDKGAMLENGEILHLGRLDDQIKLRGFRIELGEIRNTLLSLDGVSAAAVTFTQLDQTDSASARLDAYVKLDGIMIQDVVTHTKRQLPSHMQPASYKCVSEMPLTTNGKLDTKRLNEMVISEDGALKPQIKEELHGSAESQIKSKPSNPCSKESDLDQKLVKIWQEVLQQPIDVEDNFFDLGGNSLYAIRISAEMKKSGLPPINMRELYVHQTISNLVNVLREEYSIA